MTEAQQAEVDMQALYHMVEELHTKVLAPIDSEAERGVKAVVRDSAKETALANVHEGIFKALFEPLASKAGEVIYGTLGKITLEGSIGAIVFRATAVAPLALWPCALACLALILYFVIVSHIPGEQPGEAALDKLLGVEPIHVVPQTT